MGLVVLKITLAAGAPEPLRKRRQAIAALHYPGIWRDDRDDASLASIVALQAKQAPIAMGRPARIGRSASKPCAASPSLTAREVSTERCRKAS